MKKTLSSILTISLLSISCNAKELISQVEAKRTFYIQSEVSGIVKDVKLNFEKKNIKNKETIISIDTYKEKLELKKLITKKLLLTQLVDNTTVILEGILNSSSKSKSAKLSEANGLINLKMQLADINERIEQLQETIKRKQVSIDNLYINEIYVSNREYVNPGTKLMKVSDISKKQVKFFLTKNEIDLLKEGKYKLLNDKKEDISSNWNIKSIDLMKSETMLSGYEVILVLDNNKVELSTFVTLDL